MAAQTQLLSQWHHYVSGLQQSSREFYSAVEEATKRREMPDLKFSRVEYKEGGFLSAKREYLRIKRGDLYFDVCGAPFGTGFFVSERLFLEGSFLEGFGGAGVVVKAFVKPDTMYQYDTALVMQQLVHDSVLEVVDWLTAQAQLPVLSEAQRKPVMKEFFQ